MTKIRKQLFIMSSTIVTLLIVFLCVIGFANEKTWIKIENYLANVSNGPRQKFNFDYGWKFSLGEGTYNSESDYKKYCLISDNTTCVDATTNPDSDLYIQVTTVSYIGSEETPYQTNYDVSSWQEVSLPHTYNDVDTFNNYNELGGTGQNGERSVYSGTAWYNKEFFVPSDYEGKKVYIEFEAARQAMEIYVNGTKLNYIYENGFIPVGFDLSPYLLYDQTNEITIMVDNSYPYKVEGTNSKVTWHDSHWHPNNGGLYRNAYLYVTDDLHLTLPLYSFIEGEGTYVYATDIGLDANENTTAKINVDAQVENSSDTSQTFTIEAVLKNANNEVVDTINSTSITLEPDGKEVYHIEKTVNDLIRWSTEYPYLYTVETKIKQNGITIDNNETTLGVRTVKFTSNYGFYLNDHYVELNGWGQKSTMEWAGLGAAYPDWMTYYVMNLMKEANANYVRWGHVAGSPAQIKASNELGILVTQPGVDSEGSTSSGVYDNNTLKLRVEAFRDMIIYFRNNPSIVMWELGNHGTITAINLTPEYVNSIKGLNFEKTTGTCSVIEMLYALVEQYDYGNRASTESNVGTFAATSSTNDRVTTVRSGNAAIANYIDVSQSTLGGSNLTGLPIVEGEYNRLESRRSIWDTYTYPTFSSATYNKTAEDFARSQIMDLGMVTGQPGIVSKTKYSGGANWIFSDSTSHGRLSTEVDRASGEVDAVMIPKEAYYVDRVIFNTKPDIHIIGHWNYPAGTTKSVYVAANNVSSVTLYVGDTQYNGTVSNSNLWTFNNVVYENAVIRVEGKDKTGNVVVTDSITPHGEPASIKLTPIVGPQGLLASGSDVLLVDVEVVDTNGNRCLTYDGTLNNDYTEFTINDPNGAVIWRGGYNSGIANSTNANSLFLEAGINRVSLRTTDVSGTFTISAATTVSGLTSNILTLTTTQVTNTNGLSDTMNLTPLYSLTGLTDPGVGPGTELGIVPEEEVIANASVLISNYNYTGSSVAGNGIAEVFSIGSKIYSDTSTLITDAPYHLLNAEYLRLPNADRTTTANDLINFTAKRNIDIYILRDPSIPTTEWLDDYTLTTDHVTGSNGITYNVYKRSVTKGTQITIGSNSDSAANVGSAVGQVVLFKQSLRNDEIRKPFFKEDFTDVNLESIATIWTPQILGANTVTIEDQGGDHESVLRLIDNDASLVFVQKSFSPINTNLTFKFDAYLGSSVQSWLNVWMTKGKTVKESIKTHVGPETYLFSDGSKVSLRGRVITNGVPTNAVTYLVQNLNVNEWHSFEFDVDVINQQYRVKADNGNYSKWMEFYADGITSIDTLLFGTHESGNSDFLIDNVVVYPDVDTTISNVRLNGTKIESYEYDLTDYYVGAIDNSTVVTFDEELYYESSVPNYDVLTDTLSLTVTDVLGNTKTYNFHDQSTSELLSDWAVTTPENTSAEVVVIDGSEAFNFKDNNNTDMLYVTKKIPTAANAVAIRWNAKVTDDAENLFLRVWALNGDLISATTKTNVLVAGYMNRATNGVQYVNEHTLNGASGTIVYSENYQTINEWHDYEMLISIATQTYDLYVDGVLVENDMLFLNDIASVDTIVIGTGTDSSSHFYLKNVEAETIYDAPITGISIGENAITQFTDTTFSYDYYSSDALTNDTAITVTTSNFSYKSHTITKDLIAQTATIEAVNNNDVTYTYTINFYDITLKPTSKAELQLLVDEIDTLTPSDYSSTSWDAMYGWVTRAKTILALETPDQTDMSTAFYEITLARTKLLEMKPYIGAGIALIRDIKYSEDLEGAFEYETVLQNDEKIYADADSPTFRSVPTKYMNAGYFLAPNGVLNDYGTVTFVTNRPLDVLILRDRNAGAVTKITYDEENNPIRYEDTGEIVTGTHGTVYKVYKKSFPKDATVTITMDTLVKNDITNKSSIIAIKDSYNVTNNKFFYENMDLYTEDVFKFAWNAYEPDSNNYVELVDYPDGDTSSKAIHVVSETNTNAPNLYREFAKMYKKYNVSYRVNLYEDIWNSTSQSMGGYYNRYTRVWLINDSQNVAWRTSFDSALKPKVCVLEGYLDTGGSNLQTNKTWKFTYATKTNGTQQQAVTAYRGVWMDISLDIDMDANTFNIALTRDVNGVPTTTTGSGSLYGAGFTYADFLEFAGRQTGRSSFWLKDVSITPTNNGYLDNIAVTNNEVTDNVVDFISTTKDYLYNIDDLTDITVTPSAGNVTSVIAQNNVLNGANLEYTNVTATVDSNVIEEHRIYYELNTDRLRLTTLIEHARSLNEADYMVDSYANLQAPLNTALGLLSNQMASQTEIDAAANALENAIVALIEIEGMNFYYEGALYYGNTLKERVHDELYILGKSSLTFDVTMHKDVGSSYTYANVAHNRVIESSVVLPANTKITFVDKSNEAPEYYYYIVTAADEASSRKEFPLTLFVRMGNTAHFVNTSYYTQNTGIVNIDFTFIVDFENTNTLANGTYQIHVHDDISGEVIEMDPLTYHVYNGTAPVDLSVSFGEQQYYGDDNIETFIGSNYHHLTANNNTYYDTRRLGQKVGIRMSLFQNGEQVILPIGATITYGDNSCSVINNSCNLSLRDLATSMNEILTIQLGDYLYPRAGVYTVHFDFIVSPNGINLGFISGTVIENLTIVDKEVTAFKTTLDPSISNVVKHGTNQALDYSLTVVNVENPNILVSLEEKETSGYTTIDLDTYVTNPLTSYATNKYELGNVQSFIMNLKDNLPVGTYRLKFELLNNTTIESTSYEYIVIK